MNYSFVFEIQIAVGIKHFFFFTFLPVVTIHDTVLEIAMNVELKLTCRLQHLLSSVPIFFRVFGGAPERITVYMVVM